jgi:hypothetical protein
MCLANDVATTLSQYVINAGPGPKLIKTTSVKTSPIDMTIEGICGRLRLIAATEKEAMLSSTQGNLYCAGEAEKERTAMGIERRPTPKRYSLQRSGRSAQLIKIVSLCGWPQKS